MLCYRFRLYPTDTQEKDLAATLDVCRAFYNALLDERKVGHENGHSVSKKEQLRRVKELKEAGLPLFVHSHVLQVVAADIDKAYQNFFRRVKLRQPVDRAVAALGAPVGGNKNGETQAMRQRRAALRPGYPRYKGRDQFDSFGWKEVGNGFQIDGRRLKISGIGRVAVRWHREIVGAIKTLRVIRKAGKWYACFAVERVHPPLGSEHSPSRAAPLWATVRTAQMPDGSCEAEAQPLAPTGESIGIDVGISHLLADSGGGFVANPRWYRKGQQKLRRVQRSVSRKQKGGANRRKAKLRLQRHHEKIKNRRKDFLNKVAHGLIARYDNIALEDLRIANMVKNKRLSKSILDAGWNYLLQRLCDKAESAGRAVRLVDPRYTSKSCSRCGAVFQDLKLSDRWVDCECGLSLDRDTNAAINILCRSGFGQNPLASTERTIVPVAKEAVGL